MMRPTVWKYALPLALVFLVAACGSARRSEPIAGPLTPQGVDAQRAKALYDRHCYRCHLEGEGGLAPALNNKPLPRFLMRFQVRHGLGAMPSFSKDHLKDEELERILDYLVALRHHG